MTCPGDDRCSTQRPEPPTLTSSHRAATRTTADPLARQMDGMGGAMGNLNVTRMGGAMGMGHFNTTVGGATGQAEGALGGG